MMLVQKFLLTLLFGSLTSIVSNAYSNPKKSHMVKGNKEIFYYGSVHSNDTKNPMFADIQESFLKFKPDLVIIEGGYSNVEYENREQAINSGEMAFASYLSTLSGIRKVNAEPNARIVDSILVTKYDTCKIFTMYILRQTFQLIEQAKHAKVGVQSSIVDYANYELRERLLKKSNPLNFDEIASLVNNYSGINITNTNIIDKEIEIRRCIYKKGNPLANILNEAIIIRDEYTINLVASYLNKYNRIFIIMGEQHLLNQEESLKKAISKYE